MFAIPGPLLSSKLLYFDWGNCPASAAFRREKSEL